MKGYAICLGQGMNQSISLRSFGIPGDRKTPENFYGEKNNRLHIKVWK
jgi:hypothetical protein